MPVARLWWPSFQSCAVVCAMMMMMVMVVYCQGDDSGESSDSESDGSRVSEKPTIKLKIGALFDVRALHLVEAFQVAVEGHNREELHSHRTHGSPGGSPGEEAPHRPPDDSVTIVFEPVNYFVDVTDSFAVSNAMCDLIAHDVIAIVGITNASSLPTIQSYSATFHVPFLSLGSSQNVTSAAPFQLSLRPPVMAAVVDLLHYQGCSSALYMYDSDEGLMRIQDLFQAINIRELYLELDVRRIGDRAHVTEISKIIGSLHPRREICLVLDVERLDAKGIISVVQGGAPTVKDIILVTLDADMALNTLLQDLTTRPTSFNISGLQLVPSLQPSAHVHLHPHLHHPPPAFHHHDWSPTAAYSDEQSPPHNLPAGLERGLERSPHLQLRSVRLREAEREGVNKEQGLHRREDSVGDSRKDSRSGSPSHQSGDDPELKQYRPLASSNAEPERGPPSRFQGSSSDAKHPDRTSDPDVDPDPNLDLDPDFINRDLHRRRHGLDSRDPGFFKAYSRNGHEERDRDGSSPRHPVARSCEALMVDCLKVLTAALADLWDTLGDVLGSRSEESPEDLSIKCTNFVVEKKQYGADLMEALRLVHIQGETRYISFDTGGKREDYTLSVLSVRAGSTVVRNEGEWSSVTGLTSDAWSRDGVRSYTIFGNISGQPGRRVLLGVTE